MNTNGPLIRPRTHFPLPASGLGAAAILRPGQKYACMALTVQGLDPDVPAITPLAPGVWALRTSPLGLPGHWKEWLGELETSELDEANLYLFASADAKAIEVLDAENEILRTRVLRHYHGLLIATFGIRIDYARMLTGAVETNGVSVRSTQAYPRIPQLASFPLHIRVTRTHLALAANVSEGIAQAREEGELARLWRMLHAFYAALQTSDIGVRCHQLVRTVEGIILPAKGGAGKTFGERGSLLTGEPGVYKTTLRDLYEVRGKLEHLHGPLTAIRAAFERKSPADKALVASYEGAVQHMLYATLIAEAFAHACLARIFTRLELRKHLESDTTLEAMWQSGAQAIADGWGDPLAPSLRSVRNAFDHKRVAQTLEDQGVDDGIYNRISTQEAALRTTGGAAFVEPKSDETTDTGETP